MTVLENMKKQEEKKRDNQPAEDTQKQHLKEAENKISQFSEEEQEELRAEARERYNRLVGCGG